MNIYLNGKSLDFKLENEENLEEVITGIENWLSKSNLVITSVKIEDKEIIGESQDEWKKYSISELNKISLDVKSVQEIRILNMMTVVDFLTILQKALKENNKKLISELQSGFSSMIESLNFIFNDNFFKNILKQIAEIKNLYENNLIYNIINAPSEENIVIENIILEILKRVRFQILVENESGSALDRVKEELKQSSHEISEVSILLQTGKDKKAMDIIISFSEILNNFLNIFRHLKKMKKEIIDNLQINEKNIEVYYNEFNGILNELVEAFDVKDTVLIGDLLEYEISPRLDELIEFIKSIDKEELFKNEFTKV